MDNVRYVKTGEGENVRFHQLGAVDNVRYVKTGEGENVRPVKKMRWQMTAYALIGEGENVRGGKCPPFVWARIYGNTNIDQTLVNSLLGLLNC